VTETAVRFPVTGEHGGISLEGVLALPGGASPVPGVAVAHPHPLRGGDMHNSVVLALCEGLAQAGVASLRFNFRGVGASEGVHGQGVAEQDDIRAALSFLAAQPGIDAGRIGLAGYSFGARASLAVAGSVALVGLLCVAPPLSEPVAAPGCPLLVLVGDRDQVAGGGLDAYRNRLPSPDALRVVPGTDHFWWGFEQVLTQAAQQFFVGALTAQRP
jgi:hypothetical protein